MVTVLVLTSYSLPITEAAIPEEDIVSSSTLTAATPASGKTIVVASTADGGSGTLRQALEGAQRGDSITFDPSIFPPNDPATIYLRSSLPRISQGELTIDASNAGVILDGINVAEDFTPGLTIASDGNIVQGLQILNFNPGVGISLAEGAQNNKIGGDRGRGSGPLGQGNLISNGSFGIHLWGDSTSFNSLIGNLIGTDSTGIKDWSNEESGIWICDGASHNVIGPDNVIAYNTHYGIQMNINQPNSNSPIGISITGNSIHSNGFGGIDLWGDSNNRMVAPTILDFDLARGTVTGTTCANCTVEIFSDDGLQGEVYEGQTQADTSGAFTFNKGGPLTGPNLTATATDDEGNTSQFSAPVFGTSKTMVIQKGNSSPKLQIQPKKSSEIVDNRLGTMGPVGVRSDRAVDDWIYKMTTDMGYKWIRLSMDRFDWIEVEDTGAYSKHDVSPYQDKAISTLANNGIKTILTLVFWDKEMDAEGYLRWFKNEDQMQRYLDYVQFIVHHFKDRIQYYEILNEPNIKQGTQQHVEVADYINLVRRTVSVIRQEYPEAKIVAGAVSSLSNHEDNLEYFFNIIRSDVMPIVDAISWHAGSSSPEYQTKYYYNYPSLVQEIKDTASAHGFKGEYIIEELNWRTPKEPHPTEYTEYGELTSAKYYARGIVMNLGMNFTHVGLAGPSPEQYDELPDATRVIRNLCNIMAGAKPVSVPLEIQRKDNSFLVGCQLACASAKNIRYYCFSLPNSDRLIALWIDSKAIDDYSGINTTVTIEGFSAQRVTGIDILNSFEQELVTSIEDGNLVIGDLYVKDYPIILRLSP